MSQELDRPGTFRVEITDFGVNENKDTGTLGVIVQCTVLEAWDQNEKVWVDWRDSDVVTSGYINLIMKNAADNEIGVRSLAAAGWNGELPDICEARWTPKPCQAVVKLNDRSGKFSVDSLGDYDREPGGVSNIDVQRARQIQMQHGGSFRAIIGNANRAGTPQGAPPPPPPVADQPANVGPPTPDEEKAADNIPF